MPIILREEEKTEPPIAKTNISVPILQNTRR